MSGNSTNRFLVTSVEKPADSTIVIANRQRSKKINLRLLKQIASALLAELDISAVELGINLVGAKEMARVNWQFLQHEGSTDVITFNHFSPNSQRPTASCQLHGELFICVDDAIAQAREFGSSWQSEVVRYVVHGILHLLGYDDLQPELRRKMKRAEHRLVRRLENRFALAQLSPPAKINA